MGQQAVATPRPGRPLRHPGRALPRCVFTGNLMREVRVRQLSDLPVCGAWSDFPTGGGARAYHYVLRTP